MLPVDPGHCVGPPLRLVPVRPRVTANTMFAVSCSIDIYDAKMLNRRRSIKVIITHIVCTFSLTNVKPYSLLGTIQYLAIKNIYTIL
jgi:hypothetical protein